MINRITILKDPEELAILIHESYERLMPAFGLAEVKETPTPWVSVPEPNKSLLIAVAKDVLERLDENPNSSR